MAGKIFDCGPQKCCRSLLKLHIHIYSTCQWLSAEIHRSWVSRVLADSFILLRRLLNAILTMVKLGFCRTKKSCLTTKHIIFYQCSSACPFHSSVQTVAGNKLIYSFSTSLGDHKSWKHCYRTRPTCWQQAKTHSSTVAGNWRKRVRFQDRPERQSSRKASKLIPACCPADTVAPHVSTNSSVLQTHSH